MIPASTKPSSRVARMFRARPRRRAKSLKRVTPAKERVPDDQQAPALTHHLERAGCRTDLALVAIAEHRLDCTVFWLHHATGLCYVAASCVTQPDGRTSRHDESEASAALSWSIRAHEEAFAAINNVRGWWSGQIDGASDELDVEFTYRYQDVHYSKQRITEFVPNKKVVWRVLDAYLNFTEDPNEWTGTEVNFEVSQQGEQTEVRFTHWGSSRPSSATTSARALGASTSTTASGD